MQVTIAVVGASGFVGRACASAAEAQGHTVLRISAPRLTSSPCLDSSELVVMASRHDATVDLAKMLVGADIVVNAAGMASPGSSQDHEELFGANALLPVAIAHACSRIGVRRFIHVSSAAVQGARHLNESEASAPFSPYSRSKSAGEDALRRLAIGVEIVRFRPTSVQGEGRETTSRISRLARSRWSMVAGDGSAHTPQVLVENVADAILYCATTGVEVPAVVLQPSEGLTCESFLRVLGGGRAPKRLPRPLAKAAVTTLRWVKPLASHVRRLELLLLGQDQDQSWLDHRGWRPPYGASRWRELGVQMTSEVAPAGARPAGHHPGVGTVVLAVTVDQSLKLMYGFPQYLARQGWNVHVISSGDSAREPSYFLGDMAGVNFHSLAMARAPSLPQDLRSLASWIRLLRAINPDAVLLGTPKASLLGLTAARLLRVPLRAYLLRGLRLEGESGARRALLIRMERITAAMATVVVPVSRSLAQVAEGYGIGRGTGLNMLGAGSSNGVRIPTDEQLSSQNADRAREFGALGLDPSVCVVGYVGRLTPDKGLSDLVHAIGHLGEQGVNAQLLLLGAEDAPGYLSVLQQQLTDRGVTVALTGYVEDPARYYPIMDVFVLPSRREGMPNVALEAAAYGIPVVTTRATGCRDAVIEGETGLLYEAGAHEELAAHLRELILRGDLRDKMGCHGRTWVERNFSRETVWRRFHELLVSGSAP